MTRDRGKRAALILARLMQRALCRAGRFEKLPARAFSCFHPSSSSFSSFSSSSFSLSPLPPPSPSPPPSKVRLSEPVSSTSIQELVARGFVHVAAAHCEHVYVRLPRTMLRLLASPEARDQFLNNVTTRSTAEDEPAAGAATRAERLALFKACRPYHANAREPEQLLTLFSACTAYVLATPESRPDVADLAELLPGLPLLGARTVSLRALGALKDEAAAVDDATLTEQRAYNAAVWELAKAASALEEHLAGNDDDGARRGRDAVGRAKAELRLRSLAYTDARLEAFRLCSAREIIKRSDEEVRDVSKTAAGRTGVTWIRFDESVYAMQCRGGRASGSEEASGFLLFDIDDN